jgi:hypothetical protein
VASTESTVTPKSFITNIDKKPGSILLKFVFNMKWAEMHKTGHDRVKVSKTL